ncbi:hypothetical protein Y1Q_0011445 [Alligator mississippiensis]|uniref:Uncharacterized protein n=1 Tax=Alligator mississippiensis TaxID=8496 RepID=A0A151LZT8_ALLMI|nr:hypothetical protein Y1Q_0011445 [Alligator mississippiensis]
MLLKILPYKGSWIPTIFIHIKEATLSSKKGSSGRVRSAEEEGTPTGFSTQKMHLISYSRERPAGCAGDQRNYKSKEMTLSGAGGKLNPQQFCPWDLLEDSLVY